MKFNLKQFQTKNFKGVLSLLAGNTLAKLILTIGGFVLANYYGPSSYGVYTVFLSYVLILPVLSTLRLDSIMILQKGSKEIRNLLTGTSLIALLVTLLIVLGICSVKYLNLLEVSLNYYILILCGIAGVVTAWNNTQNAMFTKYKLFKQLSSFFIVSSLFSVLGQAFFYFLGEETYGLIYGWIVGLIVGFVYNLRVSKNRLQHFDFELFKESIREHSRVIKYTYPSDSINALANNIMPILILSYFTSAEVGLYGMAFKILSTPLVLISSSVSRVYFQKAFTLYNHDPKALAQLTYKVIFYTTGIIFLFVIFINTIGKDLLALFMSENWEGLQTYIFILSFWILARTAMNCISPVVIILKKNQFSLIFNLYLLLVNFIAIYIGFVKNDFLACVWAFSILSSIGYLILLGMVIYHLNLLPKKK